MKIPVVRIHEGASRGEWTVAIDALALALTNEGSVVLTCRTTGGILESRRQLRHLDQALQTMPVPFEPFVSRSASEGSVAWAACRTRPIGVDVQSARAYVDETLLSTALTPTERAWLRRQANREHAFAQLWTGKEAVLKAFGVGLAWPPNEVEVLPQRTAWQWTHVAALGRAWLSYPKGAADEAPLAVALNMGHEPV